MWLVKPRKDMNACSTPARCQVKKVLLISSRRHRNADTPCYQKFHPKCMRRIASSQYRSARLNTVSIFKSHSWLAASMDHESTHWWLTCRIWMRVATRATPSFVLFCLGSCDTCRMSWNRFLHNIIYTVTKASSSELSWSSRLPILSLLILYQ